ncbi:hypothetical protein SK128_003558 [Halocaridina rubra]|uniref:Sulfatase N-terminal domain-containing protein n=1 Tax=Halocaridina rubra TaxID=373956 RepID=A0AAN8X3Q2_HALRR
MEELARNGIILEQSYVQPVCSPTRSALMTGRYPFTIGRQHGVIRPQSPTGLLLNSTLLPQAMKDAGYSTHIIGKWHLGYCDWAYTPTMRGFDSFYGYYLGAQDYYSHTRNPNLCVEEEDSAIKEDFPYGYDFRSETIPDISVLDTYSTYAYATYVDNLLKAHNPSEPLFLYLSLQSVHSPLQVPENFTEPFQYINDTDRINKLGMVWAMDEAIGDVVDALKKTGHYDNSVIVFTTDNGGHTPSAGINWPLRGGKGSLWEGGTRGPAFIHSPLLAVSGFISETVMHVTDWYKTLIGLSGGVAPEISDGFDQWEAITEGAPSPRTTMVYNIDNENEFEAGIRKGDYKLLVGEQGGGSWTEPPEGKITTSDVNSNCNEDDSETVTIASLHLDKRTFLVSDLPITNDTKIRLYHLQNDPEERINLAETEEGLVSDLLNELQQEFLRYSPADYPPDVPEADPANFDNVWSPGWCTAGP